MSISNKKKRKKVNRRFRGSPNVYVLRIGETLRLYDDAKPFLIQEIVKNPDGTTSCYIIQTENTASGSVQRYFESPYTATVIGMATYFDCVETLAVNTQRFLNYAEEFGTYATQDELAQIGGKFKKAMDLLEEVGDDFSKFVVRLEGGMIM